jgi:hypothetical protein
MNFQVKKRDKKQRINQEMADEFMKPSQPRKFGKGGKKPTINNPDTHHGTYDLPNASVRSYSDKAKPMKFAKGGTVESKSMMKKEIGFMKKKGAPKSMIKHEKAEAKGMNMGGMAGYKKGGMAGYKKGGGIESRGKTKGRMC